MLNPEESICLTPGRTNNRISNETPIGELPWSWIYKPDVFEGTNVNCFI